ncbi:hypothetical protein pb186bvf_006221 [Paramecium bursaria]
MQNDINDINQNPQQNLPLIPITLPYEVQKNLKEQIEILSKMTFTIKDYPQIITNIQSEDLILSLRGLTGLGMILCVESDSTIQQVIDSNLFPMLIEIIDKALTPKHVLEALLSLTNLLTGNTQYMKTIIELGGIKLLVKLLSSPYQDIAEEAAWAIGNFSQEGTYYRDLILKIVANTSTKKKTIAQCTWSLSNLFKGKPLPEFNYVQCALLVFCKIIINESDDGLLSEACWALSYLSDQKNSIQQQVIDSGVVPKLIKLLDLKQLEIIIPTIRILGNIVTGNEQQTSYVIQQGLLTKIPKLLNQKRLVRQETCWALSNITAGNSEQVTQVIQNSDIVEKLFQLFQTDVDEVLTNAILVISNATQHCQMIDLEVLLKYGLVQIYVQLLRGEDVLLLTLKALSKLLKRVQGHQVFQDINPFFIQFQQLGGVEILKELQKHENQDLQLESKNILDEFHKGEDLQ